MKNVANLIRKFLAKEELTIGQYVILYLLASLIVSILVLIFGGWAIAFEVFASLLWFLVGLFFVVAVTTLAMLLFERH